MEMRAFLADLDEDARGRWRSCVSVAGASYSQLITASNQPTPWCLILVVAEDFAEVEAVAGVDPLPNVALGAAVDQTMRDEVSALLAARGVAPESLGWLAGAAQYRDIVNGIPVQHLNWNSFDADAYAPAG